LVSAALDVGFQFLVGRLKISLLDCFSLVGCRFQFLVGRLKILALSRRAAQGDGFNSS